MGRTTTTPPADAPLQQRDVAALREPPLSICIGVELSAGGAPGAATETCAVVAACRDGTLLVLALKSFCVRNERDAAEARSGVAALLARLRACEPHLRGARAWLAVDGWGGPESASRATLCLESLRADGNTGMLVGAPARLCDAARRADFWRLLNGRTVGVWRNVVVEETLCGSEESARAQLRARKLVRLAHHRATCSAAAQDAAIDAPQEASAVPQQASGAAYEAANLADALTLAAVFAARERLPASDE